MRLSSSPSLEEKIKFLIQNYDRDEVPEGRSTISVDDRQPMNDENNYGLTCGGSSRLSDILHLASTRVPLSVKREENSESSLMIKLRKKVCRKVYETFRDQYKVPTADAK